MRFWIPLASVLLLSRLAHLNILWADEDYHLAAAIQMLHGLVPYRDFWYDKPPLAALLALIFGAKDGWPLRVAGAGVAFVGCRAAFLLAAHWWTRREGYWAAALLAFFQVFYFPTAVIPWEPDTLLIPVELFAVYFAVKGQSFASGSLCAAAFLLNPKGAIVLVVCALFARWRGLAAGFALPCLAVGIWLFATSAFAAYVEQVWRWGLLYASSPGSDPQAQRGWLAIAGWAGFHSALLVAGALAWRTLDSRLRLRLAIWGALAFATTFAGLRFAPRYFDAVLAVLALPAARGMATFPGRSWLAALLLIPAMRFGPRYVSLGIDAVLGQPHAWQDVAMDQESRGAAHWIRDHARDGDTIAVWGYRPNVVVYTRLPVGTPYWDSQPLTGVPADRHLSDSRAVDADAAAVRRMVLTRSSPTFLVDGLSAYNPALDIHKYPELAGWLSGYCEQTRVSLMVIYRRCGE